MKRARILKKLNNQAGEGVSSLIVMLIATIIIVVGLAMLCVMVTMPKAKKKGKGDATSGGQIAKGDTNNLPGQANTNNLPGGKDTNNLATKEDSTQDLSTGYLVCVNLPGIHFPRTPALDRRVAEKYLAVKRDLDLQGIPTVTFNWAFRSNCQQVQIVPSPNPGNKSGRNPKAKPGTSPHEAGRALDGNVRTRKDLKDIVATFYRHGWIWLAEKDPPHFEVLGYTVGEPSHYAWIQKIQESFKQGYPKEGCRGPECGQ